MLFTPHIIHANSLLNLSVDKELYEFSDDIYDFIDRILVKGNVEDFPKKLETVFTGRIGKNSL